MKQTIVIVEDDELLAGSLVRQLTASGYDVHHAPHAITAIDLIDDVNPGVIVLDVLLAGTTALALLNELQSHDDLAAIPIVLMSNIADSLKLADLAPYGVKEILDKTIMQPDDLLAAITKAAG